MSSKASSKRPAAVSSESSNHTMVSEVPQERPNGRASSRTSRKGIAFGKRSNSMKRNPNAAVTKNGWLFKQASSGVKQWNKRWFVLVDRCLFYYKDEKEESILGSIPLLSFRVAAVQPSDNISRKYTFKVTVCWMEEMPQNHKKSFSPQAEHAGIRTYFFSAENNEEQESWIQAMGEAARVQIPPTQRSAVQKMGGSGLELTDCENIPPSKNHHHYHQRSILTRELAKAELEAKTRGEGDGRGSEKIERKPERVANKKEALVKTNGIASQDTPSEPGSPYPEAARVPSGVERTPQPNGWQYSSPTHPGSMAFPQHDGDTVVSRRSFAPRTNPEKIAQRKSSMTQLQQWVNLRRGVPPPEDLHSPNRFFPMSRRYSEDYQYYPPGVRPDSICSMPAYERVSPQWAVEDKRHPFRNSSSFQLREWKEQPGYSRQDMPIWIPGPTRQPVYYDEMDTASGSLRRMSLQPRSRSVPRSPSQGSYNRTRVYSPVRSPSTHFERMPSRSEEIYAEPSTYMMRRSVSSPKVSHFPESYRETLHTYKINEQHTDKLLGKLCEQNKVIREQERLVQQLRAEKESLESALMGTHQELEMFGGQPAYPEKLLHKKESLQNQLINIRVELSQASTALANSTMEYENLEAEVSVLHDDLWEQLNLDIQNEMLNRQIQKEIWRIQDVMEGLKKNNPSRGTDTAKHRVALGPSGTYSSNSPASPLSSASLTSPLSPFSLVSGSQSSPTKQGSNENLLPSFGIVPPRTKSPLDDENAPTSGVVRRSANGRDSRDRPKSAVFSNEMKAKMSVEEQIDRMKRHQSSSMKEKRRSLQLPANQQQTDSPLSKAPASYKVVRRHRSIHEVDISDLEAALRSEDSGKMYESPRDEIARLRKMELEPEHYDVDISKELSTPDKVLIPERYIELEPDTPLSPEEMKEKQKKVERIKTLIAKSSMQNVIPLSEGEMDVVQDPETQLQEQEKRIEISCALATEASRRGRMLSGKMKCSAALSKD
uniref:Pleckstrin homology domain containing A6 n=1 Tax=Naja naja TaxID=35670 RepID=A0A8C6VCB7_NAJNA